MFEHAATPPLRSPDRHDHRPLPTGPLAFAQALQRAIGNRATARLLAPTAASARALQRAIVTGELEATNQTHHPNYRFKIPPSNDFQTFDLDAWITRKLGVVGQGAFASPARNYGGRAGAQAAVQNVVANWNTTGSVVDGLVDAVIANNPVVNWKNADISDTVLQTAGGPDLVRLLLALKANIALRMADIPANLPQVEVVGTPKVKLKGTAVTTTRPPLAWASVVTSARDLLKANFTGAAPAAAPASHQDVRLTDQAIAAPTGAGAGAGIAELKRIGALFDQGGQMKFKSNTKTGATKATQVDYETSIIQQDPENPIVFNAGMNHLRFILYLEWRILSELLL